jgi:hypothetical protein
MTHVLPVHPAPSNNIFLESGEFAIDFWSALDNTDSGGGNPEFDPPIAGVTLDQCRLSVPL